MNLKQGDIHQVSSQAYSAVGKIFVNVDTVVSLNHGSNLACEKQKDFQKSWHWK